MYLACDFHHYEICLCFILSYPDVQLFTKTDEPISSINRHQTVQRGITVLFLFLPGRSQPDLVKPSLFCPAIHLNLDLEIKLTFIAHKGRLY